MTGDTKRIHVISCIVLSLLGTVAAYEAWKFGNWAKWKKISGSCLPLPPPLGCSDDGFSRDVLAESETDFGILAAFASLISLTLTFALGALLLEVDYAHPVIANLTEKKNLILLPACTGVLNFLCCVIATFRVNVVSALNRRQGVFAAIGLSPAYSTSFYLAMIATVSSIIVVVVISKTNFNATGRLRMSKTIKQHMARNLMYPDDRRNTKMVTFSSMGQDMEEAAAEICVKALMKHTLEEDIAENIKQTFEQQFGPTWHCAVGENFGSAVHHIASEYIEVSMPKMSVLLFRCVKPSFVPEHVPLSFPGDVDLT